MALYSAQPSSTDTFPIPVVPCLGVKPKSHRFPLQSSLSLAQAHTSASPSPIERASEECTVLNELHVDILDYIERAWIGELAFRTMWSS